MRYTNEQLVQQLVEYKKKYKKNPCWNGIDSESQKGICACSVTIANRLGGGSFLKALKFAGMEEEVNTGGRRTTSDKILLEQIVLIKEKIGIIPAESNFARIIKNNGIKCAGYSTFVRHFGSLKNAEKLAKEISPQDIVS